MKIIEVEVADENVEFFKGLLEELHLTEPLKEAAQIPEWHKQILDERLSDDNPELDKPAEIYFAKYRERGV
jgi:hypothetical protein